MFRGSSRPERIEHTVESLVKQRVMGLCLGYEDLNDHDELCRDRMLALVCESDDVLGARRHRESDQGKPLAGKSTLNRLELSPVQDKHKRYRKIEADTAGLDALLVDVFLEAREGEGKRCECTTWILQLDAGSKFQGSSSCRRDCG